MIVGQPRKPRQIDLIGRPNGWDPQIGANRCLFGLLFYSEKIVLAPMPELQLQIVEFAREHGRVTIGEAVKLTGASRNTLEQHSRILVERGTLSQHGGGRGGWCGRR